MRRTASWGLRERPNPRQRQIDFEKGRIAAEAGYKRFGVPFDGPVRYRSSDCYRPTRGANSDKGDPFSSKSWRRDDQERRASDPLDPNDWRNPRNIARLNGRNF